MHCAACFFALSGFGGKCVVGWAADGAMGILQIVTELVGGLYEHAAGLVCCLVVTMS